MLSPRQGVSRTIAVLCGAVAIAGAAAWTLGRYALYASGHPGAHRYHVESAGVVFVAFVLAAAALRRPPAKAEDAAADERIPRFLWLILPAASLVLYWPSLSIGFLSDDYGLSELARTWSVGPVTPTLFRPVPLTIWAFLLSAGLGATALHVLSVVVHGVVAYLSVRVAADWGLSRRASVLTGALVLASPLAAEAVVWLSGIFDLTATLLCLSAVLVARRYSPTAPPSVRLTLALLGLGAVLAKETAAIGAGLILIDMLARRARSRLLLLDCVVLALLAAGYIGWRLGSVSADTAPPNIAFALQRALFEATGALVAPWHMDVAVGRPWLAVTSVAIVTGVVIAFGLFGNRGLVLRRGLLAVGWILVASGLVWPVLVVSHDLQASRYLYLPTVGWVLLLNVLAGIQIPRAWLRVPLQAAIFVLLGLYLYGTVTTQRHWREAAELRSAVLAAARTNPELRRCDRVVLRNLPDTVRGAYVFRNSVPEFLAREAQMRGSIEGTVSGCTFKWDAIKQAFVRVE